MPPAGLFAAMGLSAIASSILSAVVSLVLSIGLGMLQKAMQKKPKQSGPASSDIKITVKQPNAPWRVIYGETRVGGIYAFVNTLDNNARLRLVIMLAGHEVEAIGDIWFDDEIVPLDGSGSGDGGGGAAIGKYAGFVNIHKWLGTADQPADPELLIEAADKWTPNHRLRGRAYIVVFLGYSQDKFPNGVPNITAVVKGKKVYDPRTGLFAWSDNAALCVADYLYDPTYGLGAALGSEIDMPALDAAANICDEAVPLAAGGTEPRYTINGTFETDSKPVDIIGDMLNAMAGRAIHAGGRWRILAGAWRVPVTTLDEGDLRGAFKVQTLLSRRENFNAVKGQYISADNKYQETDFPGVVSATYQAQDGGERIYKDIKLPFTNSPSRAQRLAKIELLRARQPITMPDVPFQLAAYRVQCGDVIGFSNDRMGWTAKSFEVQQATLVVDRSSDEAPLIGVNLSLRETDASIFDWDTDEESPVDPAPGTNLPDVFNVLPPAGLTVTEQLYVTRDGTGVKALARLDWVPSADAFVVRYEVSYQLVGAAEWSTQRDTTASFLELFDIEPGTYDFRVRAVNGVLVRSPWVTARAQISGLSEPPTEPQNLTIQSIGGLAVMQWTQSPDLDVRMGGHFEFRHSPAAGGSATWMASTSIGVAVPGTGTLTVLPLKAGTYLAKAVDSTGTYSTNAATVETEQATALAWATVDSLTEHPVFTGAKVGVVLDVDTLKLASVGDVVGAAGVYSFSGGIDLVTVQHVRLTGHIAATVLHVFDLIDSRTGTVDDWIDFDGSEAASADAWIEVRKTNDDPASGSPAPVWTAWQTLDAMELIGRGFEFRCQLESEDTAYNIRVEELGVVLEEVA